jgi:soluble lytic murein transglycosylase-like protein
MRNGAEVVELARARAKLCGLEPGLVCAVVEQESGWNPWLNRYEPNFETHPSYGVVVRNEAEAFVKKTVFPVSLETEIKNRCMSWGLMQILGQVAREIGFQGALPMLAEPTNGLEYGCIKLARELERERGDVSRALLRYNGGGNPKYADEVLARVAKYL